MAETNAVGRVTIRHVNLATWRRFKARAALEGREMGEYLNEVLSDVCDYMDEERATYG